MPIIRVGSGWNKVTIPDSLKAAESEFQFLDSFEELPSYNVVKDSKAKVISII